MCSSPKSKDSANSVEAQPGIGTQTYLHVARWIMLKRGCITPSPGALQAFLAEGTGKQTASEVRALLREIRCEMGWIPQLTKSICSTGTRGGTFCTKWVEIFPQQRQSLLGGLLPVRLWHSRPWEFFDSFKYREMMVRFQHLSL